jgi:uncharacterized cupredoxin-like copper-binding protein
VVSVLALPAVANAAPGCGTQCGVGCPSTCYAVSTSTNFSCTRNLSTQTTCATIASAGAHLSTCEDTCPTGYYPTAGRGGVSQCGLGYQGYQTDCALLAAAGQTLLTCEDHCPSGYVPSRAFTGVDACGGRFAKIQTQCTKASGQSFDTCLDCPAGYYPASSLSDTISCGSPFGGFRTHCEKPAGQSLLTCEGRCPSNYVPTAVFSGIDQCSGAYGKLQTRCEAVTGNSVRTCEDRCPDGYYPTATSTNLQCSTPYFNIETACSKVQGPTLTTCGFVCPQGYNLVRTESKPSCGGVYLGTASVCSTSNPQGPSIVTQPQSVTITSGQSTQLTVTASGQAPLTYQWYIGASGDTSQPIAGATGATVTVHPTVTTSYWVQVSNQHGAVASNTATVTVNPACVPPQITAQPASTTIVAGQTAALSVTATGTSLAYQWYQGSALGFATPIAGAKAATLSVSPSSTTSYFVRVSNACGSVDSSSAVVTVEPACVPLALTSQPHSVTISADQVATLSVAVSGTSPSYQWYQGTSGDTSHPVSGGTAASIVVTPSSTVSYWVRVSNSCSHVDSDTVTVTVNVCIAPVIGTQPQPATVDEGQSAILTVAAGGTSLAYQWYEGASGDTSRPVAGGNGAVLIVAPPESTSYWVRISNGCGTVDSDSAPVTVNPGCVPPAILGLGQPQSVSIVDGESATLTVTAQGTSPEYQWYEGGGFSFPIAGATGATLVVSPHTTTSYRVRVTNACGSVDSSLATVTVSSACVPPGITVAPQPATINDGQTATLTVTASGTSPTYQWYQGEGGDTSNPVSSGTGASVIVGPHATTSYWVRISNDCGTFDSGTVVVTVTPVCVPLAITAQPQSSTLNPGQSATLSVAANGTAPSFQWYLGGQGDTSSPIPGAVGGSLVVAPVTTTSYWVRASNACSQADSITAVVFVTDCGMPPAISGQPQSITIDPGQVATLSVTASGGGLSYQWYQGSTGDFSRPVQGGTGSVLLVGPSATTSYWVLVSNDCGAASSDTATVTVNTIGCGPDGTPCGGDGNHTCQGGQCVCSNCASGVCCGTAGNSYCDGQQHFDSNTGYSGTCASALAGCDSSNDFDGGNAVYHDGDILACVKHDGTYEWTPRRPSPRCQEVSPVCGFVCSTHFGGGMGFMCDQDGVWNQSPPLPYCYDGMIPDGFACQ